MKPTIIIGVLALALGGCNSFGNVSKTDLLRQATADTAAFCDMARPIYWSRKDTLATIQQVKLHNAVGKICGWRGK